MKGIHPGQPTLFHAAIEPHNGPHGWDSTLTRTLYGEPGGGRRTQVLSYGGGRQTAGMLAFAIQGRLPLPDRIVMADTSREATATWEYLERHVAPVLLQHGLSIEIAAHDLATVDLVSGGKILMPMHTPGKSGRLIPLPTYCSTEWKKRVVYRYLKQQGIMRADIWMGFGLDESNRMALSGVRWARNVFPLADLGATTADCEAAAIEVFGAAPPKSSCYMCPFRRDPQWRELRDHYLEDWQAAIAIDEAMRKLDPQVYLHHSGVPLAEADLSDNTTPEPACDAGCWT